MNAIKQVRRYLQANPSRESSRILLRLTQSLSDERVFPLAELYALDLEAFELAVALMHDWRLDRYYASRIKLLETMLGDLAPAVEPARDAVRPVRTVPHERAVEVAAD